MPLAPGARLGPYEIHTPLGGQPQVLFEGRYAVIVQGVANYDVSADGQRFLMIEVAAGGDSDNSLVGLVMWEPQRALPAAPTTSRPTDSGFSCSGKVALPAPTTRSPA